MGIMITVVQLLIFGWITVQLIKNCYDLDQMYDDQYDNFCGGSDVALYSSNTFRLYNANGPMEIRCGVSESVIEGGKLYLQQMVQGQASSQAMWLFMTLGIDLYMVLHLASYKNELAQGCEDANMETAKVTDDKTNGETVKQ